ncbi:hypothetical protein EDB89DRAFT_2227268 [Lactarius sanguifluus]|nr:hypothetical protein EDB89DRAFT_2227268 [Lactarius sanguifluus]
MFRSLVTYTSCTSNGVFGNVTAPPQPLLPSDHCSMAHGSHDSFAWTRSEHSSPGPIIVFQISRPQHICRDREHRSYSHACRTMTSLRFYLPLVQSPLRKSCLRVCTERQMRVTMLSGTKVLMIWLDGSTAHCLLLGSILRSSSFQALRTTRLQRAQK